MKKIKTEDIDKISYTDFVSLIQEENRPSGGKFTIREIAKNAFVTDKFKVLEIGCTNGFSSLEINKLTNCSVIGIDINNNSVDNANKRIKEYELDNKKIHFQYGNAEKLEFDDNYFDLIICGNAISFISDKSKAINELKRVLKPNGFISIVPIWYKKKPNLKIIKKVNNELGFEIKCTFEKDWQDFNKWGFELYYKKDYEFVKRSIKDIKKYATDLINNKKHLKEYDDVAKQLIINRWVRTMKVFNENLAMTNFSIILLRKTLVPEEEELFIIKK